MTSSALPRIYRRGQSKALRIRAKPVEPGCLHAVAVLRRMGAYLEGTRCFGVSAPQLNEPIRAFAMRSPADIERMLRDRPPEDAPWLCVNPEVVRSEGMERRYEGCLSIPGELGPVFRPRVIHATYFMPCGATEHATLSEVAARVFSHELDHLDGVLFTDRVGNPEDMVPTERFRGTALFL